MESRNPKPIARSKKKPIAKSQRMLIVGGVLAIAFIFVVGMNTTPTIADVFFACFLTSDTTYTDGYSSSKWRSLRRGMTDAQVEAIMGTPYSKNHFLNDRSEKNIWMYSRSPGGISHWKRNVIFEKGKVVDFEGEFDVH